MFVSCSIYHIFNAQGFHIYDFTLLFLRKIKKRNRSLFSHSARRNYRLKFLPLYLPWDSWKFIWHVRSFLCAFCYIFDYSNCRMFFSFSKLHSLKTSCSIFLVILQEECQNSPILKWFVLARISIIVYILFDFPW